MHELGNSGQMIRDSERVARVTNALASEELDALICTLPSNVLLLTGYWPVIGNAIAIITRDGAVGVVAPEDEWDYARNSWADCIHTFRPASLERIRTAIEAACGPLRDTARELHLGSGARIGFEGAGSFDPSSYASTFIYGAAVDTLLTAALQEPTHVNATGLLDRLRSVLTMREIACVRRACTVAKQAFASVASRLKPGMMETSVAAMLRDALLGPGRCDGFAYCMSGSNAADAYAAYQRSTDRRVQSDDFVLVHCNSHCGGFWTDITRTFVIHDMNERQRDIYNAVLSATNAAFSAVRPGVSASSVDRAARDVMTDRGFAKEFKHATGHGVGFSAINHNALPRIHPTSAEILEPGMIFNIEPAVYVDDELGNRQCNMALVTTDGAECLTPFLNDIGELCVRLS